MIKDEKTLSRLIKEQILKEFKANYRKGLYSATQKMMAYNSNRIEDMLNGYHVGKFKNKANQVSDITTARPEEVEKSLSKLLEEFIAA